MIERRIKAAKFPGTKSLDSFDFKIMPSLNKPLTMDLARCDYVDRKENIIALGPSGTGWPPRIVLPISPCASRSMNIAY